MNNLLSNWKTYLKFLDRNRTYTAIELFGLSISLLFVILIGIYVWQELSVDRFHEKRDRIYIIGSENTLSRCSRWFGISDRMERQ